MQRLGHGRLIRFIAVLLILATTGMGTRLQPVEASTSGIVVAWGINYEGALNVPAGLNGVTAVAAGEAHSLALKDDGTVVAWGYNGYGQTNVPDGLNGVIAISAGKNHSLALRNDGTVVAWGDNQWGQGSVPSGLGQVVAIHAGYFHNLAVKNDGTVLAWGANWLGQLNVPAGLSGVTAVAAGYGHSVALKNDGTVVAWGYNARGQLNVPEGLGGVTAIDAGQDQSLARRADGTVVAWGDSQNGSLNVPAGLSGVTAIDAGPLRNLALKADGTVVAWGNNPWSVPAGLSGVTAIAAGGFHLLAVGTIAPLDTTPPTITAPAAVAVNATSRAGAVVNYSVTAIDNVDPNPVVTCTPASGSTFPIGSTMVNCTATDAAGNTSSASFLVIVRGAVDQLSDLIALVQSFNLEQGISNSLDSKLQNARDALEAARAGSLTSACNKLSAFVNEVQAQADNGTLTQTQAEQLISATNQIKAVLGCQ